MKSHYSLLLFCLKWLNAVSPHPIPQQALCIPGGCCLGWSITKGISWPASPIAFMVVSSHAANSNPFLFLHPVHLPSPSQSTIAIENSRYLPCMSSTLPTHEISCCCLWVSLFFIEGSPLKYFKDAWYRRFCQKVVACNLQFLKMFISLSSWSEQYLVSSVSLQVVSVLLERWKAIPLFPYLHTWTQSNSWKKAWFFFSLSVFAWAVCHFSQVGTCSWIFTPVGCF